MDTEAAPRALSIALNDDVRIVASVLFGSMARGAPRPDSDCDLALLYHDEAAKRAVGDDLVGMLGWLGVAAGRVVHLVDLETADPALVRRIHAEGRVLLDRSEGRLQALFERRLIEYFDWQYARDVIDADQAQRLGA